MNCLQKLENGQYKCPKLGFIVQEHELPLRCNICKNESKTMPSLWEQAKNLATSLAKHAADGFKHVSQEELLRRIEICNQCDQLDGQRCAACGCFLLLKAKWASEVCPLGKWGNTLE